MIRLVANELSTNGMTNATANPTFGTYFGTFGSTSRHPPSHTIYIDCFRRSEQWGLSGEWAPSSRQDESVLTNQPESDPNGFVR